ncbi:glycosyltransferase family 4 protein [Celeribacter neptunius]|uniref:Glycosyltransferase involved in cell wall bisynthesis n=1 Tax=Celeribacter neptunius TaxID=588602 RepID=A0A1I3PMX6_9RHOB|nr:glycosyltransferase family 4 protein [Celeribacter neptunius]SFJ22862.1 Glycosyltransferase involved in cell wall bisynthesis [Celeribacter neptunius]
MGGMETYSEKLSDRLRAYGEVEVIALPGHADGSTPGAWELLRFGAKTAFSLLSSAHPAPVTHVADMASWPLALAARLRKPSARRVLSAHGTDVSFAARDGLLGKLYRLYLKLGARLLGPVTVIANSGATARAAEALGFRDTVIVPLAAEIASQMDGSAAAPNQTILFSGRLIPLKGFRWFAENVLPRLPETMEVEVAGTIWDAGEGAALETPRVRFLGRLEQAVLHRHMAAAMCVIIPNVDQGNGSFEGFGLVAVETAVAGGVVVAAGHGGLKDAVKDGETGFLLAPGQADQWVAKIEEIAAWSPERRAEFIEKARHVASSYYNWDRVARDTARHYIGETAET